MKKILKKPHVPAIFILSTLACFFAGCCGENCGVPVEEKSEQTPENPPLVGAYSEWISPVPADSLAVFSAATKNTKFSALVPVRVSTQVVAGTNYRFDCGEKILVIFQPLPCYGGEPKIVSEGDE